MYVVRCTIWYHLYNFKNLKNTHGGVLILVKLQATAFTKNNTPPWVLLTFFKLYKWYQIAQRITLLTSELQRVGILGICKIPNEFQISFFPMKNIFYPIH